jgi:pSer/pThr/pTyr-binding forkhead associated (FHA) protein
MKAYIVHEARIFTINTVPIKLGRNLDNNLVLSNKSVSRNHAEIYFENETFYLMDKGSTSGTYLNDSKITEPAVLNSGDSISLAEVTLTFYTDLAHLDTTTKHRTSDLDKDSHQQVD